MNVIIIIAALTSLVSFIAFREPKLFYKYQLNPYNFIHKKEYYRILTHAFLHGDWGHLIINMLVFLSFGSALLDYFRYFWGNSANILFLTLYISAILISSIYSIYKNANNVYYNAIGASGAVSAVLFASIFFDPWHKVYFFGILPIPGIIFGLLYLGYSYYMGKKNQDNIGHDAHFFGAVYGFIFPILIQANLIEFFTDQLFS